MRNVIYPGNWLCLIELVNTQQSYAKCLQLIQWLEKIDQGGADDELKHNDFLPFFISRMDSSKICNENILLKQESYFADKNSKKYSEITSKEKLLLGLEKERIQYQGMIKKNHFSYYFRIHLNGNINDITDLQYFVLLLQMQPSIWDRVAVRLMEEEGKEWSASDFFRVSHFLRFIQKKYHCFFACYDKNLASLRPLRQDTDGTQTSFLPMLEVNGQIYRMLNKTWFLTYTSNQKWSYNKLYTAISLQNCRESDMTETLFRIGLRMLFKSLSGRKYASDKKKEALLKFLVELVRDIQGITPLDMLLFGALAGDKLQVDLDSTIARECMGEVQMLSLAISQILENIINHSESNQGVFTFRIQNNQEYLRIHYPDYANNMGKGCLELLIADGNRVDSIVDHFLNSNKADIRLRNNSSDICLGQLLGDCKDGKISDIWQTVRKERPEMCHGLISFANSVSKLKGAFWVRSAPEIENKSYRNLYYFNNTENNYEADKLLFGSYIPGTQFSIVINRTEKSAISSVIDDDWAFDFDKLVYATTYPDLAKALTFEKNIIDMILDNKVLDSVPYPMTQIKKDEAASWWKNWFDSFATQRNLLRRMVFQCDLETISQRLLEQPELGEPFCKGFLNSHFFVEPFEDSYCCILFRNASAYFSRIFAATLRVVETQGIAEWEKTCVYFIFRQYKGSNLPYCATVMQDLLELYEKEKFEKEFPRLFPDPLFIKNGEDTTWFEKELLRQANTSIAQKEGQGFKILETHMRLGNKVHLDEFYEMALFFENPNYAYYTAFLFLRTILSEYPQMLYSKPKLLFYGYASYSRAIIWAILQILNQYKKGQKVGGIQNQQINPEIEFIIYQNDLKLDSEEPQIQMYYSREQWQRQPHEIWNPEDTTLISIVPISSSLTTFDKMKKELNQETGKSFASKLNYTAFWVRNRFNDKKIRYCTNEEKQFWEEVDPDAKKIKSKFIDGEIRYLTYVTSTWRDPLGCKKCFPDDPIFEFPLVETDSTSTVPTQQFYLERDSKDISNQNERSVQRQKNDERVARLKGNMLYGHISKGESHDQYFIKNQVYFQQERKGIAAWLEGLRKKAINNGNPIITSQTCINVLIIPQKADNVEFSQYVYEYYFQGCAECVIVNTEKEFRSNFKAVYSGLFDRLHTAVVLRNKVKFHYVDTSLQSGRSYNRAFSLLSACVEDWEFKDGVKYEFGIEQVFLLLSRLSESSKRQYVKNPDKEFHAYTQLDISAMRTFGDSCVPCKLQQEALRYYKKAATKSISSYWERKVYDRACLPFDQVEMNENEDIAMHEEGYRRMICAHRAAYYIRPIQGGAVLDYFIALRSFFDEICNANTDEKTQSHIYQYINQENRKDWLAAGLKVIARPFFAYDYKTRCAVMDMYLLLSEYWIGGSSIQDLRKRLENEKSGVKQYLLKEDNIRWIEIFANNLVTAIGPDECDKLAFIRNNILKSLADIKSNYILRKNTLLQLSSKISTACQKNHRSKRAVEFYQHYLRSILRMTHSSSDETKSLWLEYLLQFGEEYKEEEWSNKSDRKGEGITRLVAGVSKDVQEAFKNFLEILLVENNRPIYQLVVELHKKIQGEENISECEKDDETITKEEQKFFDEYRTRKSAKFLQFGKQNNMSYSQLHALHEFLILLNRTSHKIDRYNDLGKALQQIVEAETTPQGSVVLFGENRQIDDVEISPVAKYLNLPDYFELYPQYIGEQNDQGKTEEQINFEKVWKFVKTDTIAMSFLNENGFYLLQQGESEKRVNIIIKLENNYDTVNKKKLQKIDIQKIEPIYIYIPCSMRYQQALGLTRKILMFRRRLIEWLETDFNNNAIAVLSRQQYLARVLSTDKMGDHAENDFVECQEKLLLATSQDEFKEENETGNWENSVTEEGIPENIYEVPEDARAPLDGSLAAAREWFFLRSYVNSRISRLFRTMVRTEYELGRGELINVENYYARDGQSVMMRPVKNLSTVFFTPIKVGYIRKNYLRQMMDTITFTIQGIPDYQVDGKLDPDANIKTRLRNVEILFKDFCCISLYFEKGKMQCAYLAEYLTAILLDCFISGLKAGEIWNQTKWGGDAFKVLQEKRADEKCEIELYREHGEDPCGNMRYDYLVIRNKVYCHLRSKKKGFGMSQAAIRWYVDSLWRECIGGQEKYPEVQTKRGDNQYIIKLPILEWKENNE